MRPTPLALVIVIAALVVALAPATASAKKNDPNIPLEYTPTTAVAAASAVPTSDMRKVAASISVEDDRGYDDPNVIGSRTDDDDRRVDLVATNDLAEFVQESLTKQSREWRFRVEDADEAVVHLVTKLTQFAVEETNQAVGATYEAKVTLEIEMRDASGKELASGNFSGDASRYGKKFSKANTNEVLSDALAEAWAEALGDSDFRSAWGDLGG